MAEDLQDCANSVVVRRLTKTYGGIRAIDGVSFRIGKGEVVGFLGPNGAGKSTTMRILAGMMPATSGTAHICGISVANFPEKTRNIVGYMPENNPLPEDLRVVEYLRFRARLKGVPAHDVKRRVDEVMKTCELHRKAARRVIGNLSKGFRQRVGIADAILSNPNVIIMDEPTIGLDPHQILAIRKLVASLRGKMSVIISSHILPEIELMCDRVIIINQGIIVASGSPERLRNEFIKDENYEVSLKCEPDEFAKVLSSILDDISIKSVSNADVEGYRDYVLKAPVGRDIGAVLISELSKDTRYALRSLSHKKPSLEEIFMAATRRSWDEVRSVGSSEKTAEEDMK